MIQTAAQEQPDGYEPPRCQTCKYWTRQPDKVYQPTEWQKPVGPPQITRFGTCSMLEISWREPATEDMLATNENHCSEERDTITTGPLFGCIHHVPNAVAADMADT